ncbi:GNAT family N-acetyltransferase [Streptosporangium lutulentum]|uniref:RimJ/RimL family protein N-acetyltransferase n=1 Tax=Streptosporangium lutulentum TaxID=1461250 RepID=A0ABT9QAP2_9ACTN|nr:GNAT family N-acetyltransferase [Streptosporangium lutulentum]MDP9843837.1 RimJ/RimL family protein N-acetyltransferase [Streptosporangium lutulentum]
MTVALRAEATPSAPALFLRPWNDGDVPSLVEVYRDPVLRHWTTLSAESVDDAVRWLDVQRRGWETGERLSFAVHEDRTGSGESESESRLVANVVLKRTDRHSGSAEVGYWTAAHARGRGVAPRALEALTVWAFDTFAADKLERLELLHQVDNTASCRVAEKARYRFHEVLPARPPFPRDGHLHVRRADAPL